MSYTKYRVFLERKAEKQIRALSPEIVKRLREKIERLKDGFLPELDIKKLKGYKDHYRLRVGEY